MASLSIDYNSTIKKYPVLSIEEERELIKKWRHDETKLRELLVLHNISCAIDIGLNHSHERISSVDDSIQRAIIGLVQASKKFDFDKGVRFISYASWYAINNCKRAYSDELLGNILDKRSTSLDAPILSHTPKGEGEEEISRLDRIMSLLPKDYIVNQMSDENIVEDCCYEDLKCLLETTIDSLTRFPYRDREMAKLYLGTKTDGSRVTYRDIGEKYKIAHNRVRVIIVSIYKKVREVLSEYYWAEEDIKQMVEKYEENLNAAKWMSPTYKEVAKIDEKLEEERQFIERAKQEKISKDDIKAKLKERMLLEQMTKLGIALPSLLSGQKTKTPPIQPSTSEPTYGGEDKKGEGDESPIAPLRDSDSTPTEKTLSPYKQRKIQLTRYQTISWRGIGTFVKGKLIPTKMTFYPNQFQERYLALKEEDKSRNKQLYKVEKNKHIKRGVATLYRLSSILQNQTTQVGEIKKKSTGESKITYDITLSAEDIGDNPLYKEPTLEEQMSEEIELLERNELEAQMMNGAHFDDVYEIQDAI